MTKVSKIRILMIVAVSILVGTFLSPIIFHSSSTASLFLSAKNSDVSPAVAQAVTLENAFQEVFDKVSPSVVSIATERTVNVRTNPLMNDPFFEHFFGGQQPGRNFKQKQTGLGSGIILNDEGYILTNEHVARDMDKLTVKLKNKKTFEAKVVGSDRTMDLALLKIKPSSDLKPVVLGDSSVVKVGNWAIAIGAPLGLEQSFTVGVVSAIARSGLDASGMNYIQTDAAINQGNSGGPLLNIRGEVVGINRMILSQSGGNIGIGLTIPINEAKRVIEDLKTKGKVKRAWLGVGLDVIHEEEKNELGLSDTKGALVKQIIQGSPADKSGIQVLDVITKIGDKEVDSPEDVINYVRSSTIGKRLELKLVREKSTSTTTITPQEKPN
ncbi:MAG: trypsin-like peptidase domain-containing protein [Leptospiraceae bacterium]|nr:trypsin-like peptidase domain-containing protein [Leptospiraceae bacterium]